MSFIATKRFLSVTSAKPICRFKQWIRLSPSLAFKTNPPMMKSYTQTDHTPYRDLVLFALIKSGCYNYDSYSCFVAFYF